MSAPSLPAEPTGPRIALWLKAAYSAFVAILVPVYWTHYGAANFLYFCDLALLITLVGIWLENPLLVSMPTVGILAPQTLWLADYAGNFFGVHLTGMSDYMFDRSKPMFLRGLSLFHGWLPILLVYLVCRLGYDRRAFIGWSVLAVIVLLVCYLFMPPPGPNPGNAAVNINYVFGMSDTAAQTWMHPLAWLACLLAGLPLLMFLPAHLVLALWKAAPATDCFSALGLRTQHA